MKILEDSIQEKMPTPEKPVKIDTMKVIIKFRNGEEQEIELLNEPVDGIFKKENDKWYLERRPK